MRLAATVAAWMVVAFLGADKLGMAAAVEDSPAQQVTQQTTTQTASNHATTN